MLRLLRPGYLRHVAGKNVITYRFSAGNGGDCDVQLQLRLVPRGEKEQLL